MPLTKNKHNPIWQNEQPAKSILTIRLQAMGDMVISLRYLQKLHDSLAPGTKIDFLTRKEVMEIPKSLRLFNSVYAIGGGRNNKLQWLSAILLIPKLKAAHYEVVIDLQNNRISRFIRWCLHPKAWSQFDKFGPLSAGDRNQNAIEQIGFKLMNKPVIFEFSRPEQIHERLNTLLIENGWDNVSKLIIINPAGAFSTRNLPLEHYYELACLWLNTYPNTQFLILGLSSMKSKSSWLKLKLENKLIDLVGKTTPFEAFVLVKQAQFVLSEDSGLMHMSWVNEVPTIAIFGSTRSDWARPLGKNSLLLSSDDLICGNCMREKCLYGDNHCLTRYTGRYLFNIIDKFISCLEIDKQIIED